jgi:hypothetical protein
VANESKNVVTRDGVIVRPVKLLDLQTSTGPGQSYHLGRGYASFGIEIFRGTTTALLESTAATVDLQGQIGSTGTWHKLGATITVNSATPTIVRSSNHIPVVRIRATVLAWTSSAGAASTAERRNTLTMWVIPAFGSS